MPRIHQTRPERKTETRELTRDDIEWLNRNRFLRLIISSRQAPFGASFALTPHDTFYISFLNRWKCRDNKNRIVVLLPCYVPNNFNASLRRASRPWIVGLSFPSASRACVAVYPNATKASNTSASCCKSSVPPSDILPNPNFSLSSKTIFSAVFRPIPETFVRYEVSPEDIALRKVFTGAKEIIPRADLGPMPEIEIKFSKNSAAFC